MMTILIFVLGFACGLSLGVALLSLLAGYAPSVELHHREPTTLPLPLVRHTEAIKLPTGTLTRKWHGRISRPSDPADRFVLDRGARL